MPAALPLNRIQANGLKFAYFEDGEGPLALCMHGFPDTPHTWLADVLPALVAAGYRVVAPFTRGYGPTEVPADGDYSADTLSKDVLALIEALGEESAVLVGHDWGAYASHLAALRAPERVRALVAIDIPHPGAIRPGLSSLWSLRHFLVFQLRGRSVRRLMRNDCQGVVDLWRRWSPQWNFGDEDLADIRECFQDEASVGAAVDYYRSFLGDQFGERSRKIAQIVRSPATVPTLSIAGACGPVNVADFERAERYYKAASQLLVIPDAGHFPHREAPQQVVEALLAFLGEHASAKAA